MSQYSSRIHIKVSSPDVWLKYKDEDDADFDLANLAVSNRTAYIIDGEWSADEDELTGIVEALSETLGKDGIIIADTTNINVDPYDYCICYFGDGVRTKEFGYSEMFFKTSIADIAGWLNFGRFRLSSREKDTLFCLGIASTGNRFESFSTDLSMPERVTLRETSFEGRAKRIENTFLGEEVYFVHSKDSYDPNRLEVISDLGSLGYLPSDVSDRLTPVLLNKRLKYNAKIVELVPVSKRNKNSKSSIVSISIDAEFSDHTVEPKTSVPSIDREAYAERQRLENERKAYEAAEKAESERKARDAAAKAEAERKTREAAEKAEAERKAREAAEKAEAERKAREAAEKAEAERKAREAAEKAEAERKAREAAEKAREAAEKAEAERKAREAAEEAKKKEAEEKQRAYEKAVILWKQEMQEAENARRNEIFRIGKLFKEALSKQYAQKYTTAKETLEQQLIVAQEKRVHAEETIASLGLFKFNEKKIQLALIAEADKEIHTAKQDLADAEIAYNVSIGGIEVLVQQYVATQMDDVARRIPLPIEPEKPIQY